MIEESGKHSGIDPIEHITELARLIRAPIVDLGIENLGEERPFLQIVKNKLHRFAVDNAVTPKGDSANNQRDRQQKCPRDQNWPGVTTDSKNERMKRLRT